MDLDGVPLICGEGDDSLPVICREEKGGEGGGEGEGRGGRGREGRERGNRKEKRKEDIN